MSAVTGRKRPRPAASADDEEEEYGAGLYPRSAAADDAVDETSTTDTAPLRARVVALITKKGDSGLSAASAPALLKITAEELLPVLQSLVFERRVELLKAKRADGTEEQRYRLVAVERSSRLAGLQDEEEAVLALIEKAGNQGLWVRSIKLTTKLQQTLINKILKKLEGRKLIKPVKSIAYKNRRMYMAFGLEPAKELTGGVWYSEQQLDVEFITQIRSSIIKMLRDLGGSGTPAQVADKLKQAGVSHVPLKPTDVQQVMDTLVFEGWIDYENAGRKRITLLHKPEHAEFPSRATLVTEFEKKPKSRGKPKDESGDYVDDAGDLDADDDDEDGEADELSRKYILLPKRPIAHVDHLSSVPCGTCPVASKCTPGGVISPETCIYMSHWMQW